MIRQSVKRKGIINKENGVALLIVLWVITLLMVFVVSFSILTRTEANSTFFFRDRVQKKFFAEAALERAIMELYHRQTYKNQTAVFEGSEVLGIDGRNYDGAIGTGRYTFRLFNESGKININRMGTRSGVILNNLLVNLGVAKEKADIIVDSILDWIDADDLRRLNGAESEYYQSLPNPYNAKNGRLNTLEELLLIKEMSPDILFGTKEQKGLIHFLTIYSSAIRVNVNAAPKEVLMAIPGMTEDIVNKIIDLRDTVEFKTIQDLRSIVGINYASLIRFVDVMESNVYTIETVGFQREEKKGYGIRAVAFTESGGTPRYLYYKSPAEIRE